MLGIFACLTRESKNVSTELEGLKVLKNKTKNKRIAEVFIKSLFAEMSQLFKQDCFSQVNWISDNHVMKILDIVRH